MATKTKSYSKSKKTAKGGVRVYSRRAPYAKHNGGSHAEPFVPSSGGFTSEAEAYLKYAYAQEKAQMTDLIKALTDLAIQATAYLAKQNGAAVVVPAAAAPAAPEAAAEPKKTRKTKDAPAPEAPAAPAAPAAPTVSAEQIAATAKEADTVAREFVAYFANATPNGLAQAKAILTGTYKVNRVSELNYTQQIEFIANLKAQIANAL